MPDFRTNWIPRQTFAPAAQTADADGATVDTQHEKRSAFEVNVGLFTDGVHTITFEDSPDGSTWTAIAAANLKMPSDAPTGVVVGASLVIDDVAEDNQVYTVEYNGIERYLRAVKAITGETTGAVYGVNVVSGDRRYAGAGQFGP